MLTHPRRRPGRRLLLRAAVIPLLLALPSCGSETTIIEPDPEGLLVLRLGNHQIPQVIGVGTTDLREPIWVALAQDVVGACQ